MESFNLNLHSDNNFQIEYNKGDQLKLNNKMSKLSNLYDWSSLTPYSKRSDGIGQTVHKSLTNDIINQESSQTYSSADLDLEMGGSSRTGLLSGDRLTDTLGGSLCVDCKLPKL